MPNPIDAIAAAVKLLAAEHGLPNRFSAREIALCCPGVNAMTVGRYLGGKAGRYLGVAAALAIDEILSEQAIRVQAYERGADGRMYIDVCETDT